MRRQRTVRAADAAKRVLRNASQRLLTSDPTRVPELDNALDHSLDWSMGDSRARLHRPFEPCFSETSANTLSFLVSPGDASASAQDRADIASQVMCDIVGHQFGSGALSWLQGRMEPYAHYSARRSNGLGAMYTTGVDRHGVSEAAVTYEWGPDGTDALPGPVYDMARQAVEVLPGLVPFHTTIRCGRRSGGQQVTFEVDRSLPLDDLKPLMESFGMGHRHGGLMSLTGFVLGARFTLPPRTSTITLLRTQAGTEMRLDVNLDALPDTPQQLLPLLRLPMIERPRSLAALDRWLTALTPEGYYGPGNVSVLSIRVRADMPARMALYLRPVQFQPGGERPGNGAPDGIGNGAVNGAVNGGNGALTPGEFAAEDMPV